MALKHQITKTIKINPIVDMLACQISSSGVFSGATSVKKTRIIGKVALPLFFVPFSVYFFLFFWTFCANQSQETFSIIFFSQNES